MYKFNTPSYRDKRETAKTMFPSNKDATSVIPQDPYLYRKPRGVLRMSPDAHKTPHESYTTLKLRTTQRQLICHHKAGYYGLLVPGTFHLSCFARYGMLVPGTLAFHLLSPVLPSIPVRRHFVLFTQYLVRTLAVHN